MRRCTCGVVLRDGKRSASRTGLSGTNSMRMSLPFPVWNLTGFEKPNEQPEEVVPPVRIASEPRAGFQF